MQKHIVRPARAATRSDFDDMPPKALVVLRAARMIFLEHGFSAATTDMIQREAGVSKSTVYAHYPNKESLFVAVIEAECASHADKIRAIVEQSGDLRAILLTIARAYLEIVLSPDGLALFRVIVAEAPSFPALARAFYLAGPYAIIELISKQLASAAAEGKIDVSEIGRDAAAAQFTNLVRSEAHIQYLTHPKGSPSQAQIDQWATSAVVTFCRAFCV